MSLHAKTLSSFWEDEWIRRLQYLASHCHLEYIVMRSIVGPLSSLQLLSLHSDSDKVYIMNVKLLMNSTGRIGLWMGHHNLRIVFAFNLCLLRHPELLALQRELAVLTCGCDAVACATFPEIWNAASF